MFNKIFLLFFCFFWSLNAFANDASEDEELFARRIYHFWRDDEFSLARSQIKLFLEEYPTSPLADHCYYILGEMALSEKKYKEAVAAFDKILSEELMSQLRVKRWHSLYQQKLYTQLFEEIAPHASRFSEKDEEAKFYYAESCFREALMLLDYEEGLEQARTLCEEALPYYEQTAESPTFGLSSKMALAEIHRLLNHPEEAVALYTSLSTHLPADKSTVLLFHAAMILTELDQTKAMLLFSQIARSEHEKSSEAAGMWFYLLAKSEQWETLVKEKSLLLSRLSKEKKALLHYYLGKTYFDMKEYEPALEHFELSLNQGLKPPQDKSALLSLLICSKETANLPKLEKIYSLLEQRHGPLESELGRLTLLRAQAYRDAGQTDKAIQLLETILENQWQEADQAYYEKVVLVIGESLKNKDWEKLASLLEESLGKEGFFNDSEREKMQILLAESNIILGRYQTATSLLHNLQQLSGESAKTLALLAECHLRDGSDPEKPLFYGERALFLDPGLKELHLPLFNAYVELAKENPEGEYEAKAADHLYAGMQAFSISLENQLWLANTYFAAVEKEYNPEKAQRSILLLEPLTDDPSRFDEPLVRLATLYEWSGQIDKALQLLGQLSSPAANLRLANLYHSLGKKTNALQLYQNLEELADLSIAGPARLQVARYLFARLPVVEKRLESPHMKEILRRLLDLKLRKSLTTEPVHLEAALDHAEFSSTAIRPEERERGLLELFLKVKEEFTTDEDIWSKDYHATRALLPEQNKLYQAYMRYLDARIFLLQAKMAKKEGRITEGQSKEKAARALLSTLRQGRCAVTKYLVEKATACSS